MKESEIVAAIAEKGRNLGLHVMVTSGDRATRRQMSGLPDILAWGNDRFLSLEVKRPGGELRDSQIELLDALNERIGRHVYHAVVYSVDQGLCWLAWCADLGRGENHDK